MADRAFLYPTTFPVKVNKEILKYKRKYLEKFVMAFCNYEICTIIDLENWAKQQMIVTTKRNT